MSHFLTRASICVGLFSLTLLLSLGTSSCRKFFTPQPTDSRLASDLGGAQGLQTILNGVYRYMRTIDPTGDDDATGALGEAIVYDLMGDDMAMVGASFGLYTSEYVYSNTTTLNTSSRTSKIWNFYYRLLDNLNLVINTAGVAAAQRGQALAMRAYCYYYLVNLYTSKSYKSDSTSLAIPLYTEPTQTGKGAATVRQVYAQIRSDLNQAIADLTRSNFVRAQKSEVDKFVAHGLLARTYLAMQKWAEAESEAKLALGLSNGSIMPNGGDLMSVIAFESEDFSNIDNIEWMWGLPANSAQQTVLASFQSHLDPTISGYAALGDPKYMSEFLYNSYTEGDVRKKVVAPFRRLNGNNTKIMTIEEINNMRNLAPPAVPFRVPFFRSTHSLVCAKMRDPNSGLNNVQEYVSVIGRENTVRPSWIGAFPLMRKAEMYLIIAEAEARNGSGQAMTVLNMLREARGATRATANGNGFADTVMLERRKELWGEGFRIFDIKRLDSPVRRTSLPHPAAALGGPRMISAQSDSLRYRIPQAELNNNPLPNNLR